MNREFLDLGRVGKSKFAVTRGIESQKVGILGLGKIGIRVAEMLEVFKPQSITYYSQNRHEDVEDRLGVEYKQLEEVLSKSDIIFLCVSDEARNFIASNEFNKMKKDALFVNITHPGIVDENALLAVLQKQKVRAISDFPMTPEGFDDLPLARWYCMNSSNTVTHAGVKLMSDMAVDSMLNLLSTGKDKYSIS